MSPNYSGKSPLDGFAKQSEKQGKQIQKMVTRPVRATIKTMVKKGRRR